MSDTSETILFYRRTSECVECLILELKELIEASSELASRYFKVDPSEELEKTFLQVVRDYKIVCRKWELIDKRLKRINPELLTVSQMQTFRAEITEAWLNMDEVQNAMEDVKDQMNIVEISGGLDQDLEDMTDTLDDFSDFEGFEGTEWIKDDLKDEEKE